MTGEEREQFILSNMGLVKSIAVKFKDRGLTLNDLIQEGCLGLIQACDKYDPSRGQFSTMATPWIKGAIRRAISREKVQTDHIDKFEGFNG